MASGSLGFTGAVINLPAVLIVLALGWICYVGVKESATLNSAMVYTKVGIIIVFVLAGMSYVDTPTGILSCRPTPALAANSAGAACFRVQRSFSSRTSASIRPPRPRAKHAILSAMSRWEFLEAVAISAVLYIAMGAVMTGMVPYTKLDVAAPVAVALDAHPQIAWLGFLVEIGAVVGMTSVILMSLLGQPRIFLAMAEDGLLPPSWKKVHPVHRTPHVATAIAVGLRL